MNNRHQTDTRQTVVNTQWHKQMCHRDSKSSLFRVPLMKPMLLSFLDVSVAFFETPKNTCGIFLIKRTNVGNLFIFCIFPFKLLSVKLLQRMNELM